MTFADAYAYLLALPRFSERGADAYRPGLAGIVPLLAAMGQPHEAFPSVHVAGTNGKGSTASMLAAIGTAAGRRVGLHTSPHLLSVGERMRIDGRPAPETWLADAVARFRPVFDAEQPTFFEATTALSFLYFAEQRVDLAIVEVGLGGRLDATNVLLPRLAIITQVGLDHQELLGSTLAEIAREKAGIIKQNVPVLTAEADGEAGATIRAVAEAHAAPLHTLPEAARVRAAQTTLDGLLLDLETPRRRYEALRVDLPGLHQQTNAALAVRAAELILDELTRDAGPVYAGLGAVRRRAGLRGRLEVVRRAPLVVADVAHNPDGLDAALAFLAPQRGDGRLLVLLGLLRDKDAAAMARLLAEAGALVYAAGLESERAWPAEALAGLLRRKGVPVAFAGPFEAAWSRLRETAKPPDVVLVTGSHQVVAPLLATLAEGASPAAGT